MPVPQRDIFSLEHAISKCALGISYDCLKSNLKIVIIGAGLSGLACAFKLFKCGFKDVTILEAQETVGGRVCTEKHGESILELGAQWLHGSMSLMHDYCSKHCLLDNCSEDDTCEGAGKFLTSSGELISQDVIEDVKSFLNSVKDDIDAGLHNTSKSVEDVLRNAFNAYILKCDDSSTEAVKKSFLKWYLLFEIIDNASENSETLSARSYFEWAQCSDVPYHINFKNGFSSIIDTLCEEIPVNKIKLNVHVKHIKWTPTFAHKPFNKLFFQGRSPKDFPVELECQNGETFPADCTIITSSLGYLKENMSDLFQPILPDEKIAVYSCLGFGTINKIYLMFEEPFWSTDDLGFQLLWSDEDLRSEKLWESSPWVFGITGFDVVRNQPKVLLGWIGGHEARMIEDVEDSEVGIVCAKLLREFSGQSNIPDPIQVSRSRWYNNEFVRGAYSNRPVQFYESGCSIDDIQRPLTSNYVKENREEIQWPMVMFAGEHTDQHNFSSAHGAFDSGWREAERLESVCWNILT